MLRDAALGLLMLIGPTAVAQMATPTPAAEPATPIPCPAPSESMIQQKVTYPDHIAISADSLATFARYKPKAKYGVVVIVTYLDGHTVLKTANHPDLDAAFRLSLIDFGGKLVLTPTIPGCQATAGGVFLMIFTIPDGRVRLAPITSKDAAAYAVAATGFVPVWARGSVGSLTHLWRKAS
jgi:hypothetical protein